MTPSGSSGNSDQHDPSGSWPSDFKINPGDGSDSRHLYGLGGNVGQKLLEMNGNPIAVSTRMGIHFTKSTEAIC